MMIHQGDKMFKVYLSSLVDKTFKILPLHEEKNKGLEKYIQSLMFEMFGLQKIVIDLDVDSDFVSLVATLEALSQSDLVNCKSDFVKREVFKCINIIKRIQGKVLAVGEDK